MLKSKSDNESNSELKNNFTKELQILFPKTDDNYSNEIQDFFETIVSLVSTSFMGINITREQSVILSSQQLEHIYRSYQGKLTKPEYLVRAFVASTYHLPTINPQKPTTEWIWIAKLCHLLIYFAQHDLPQRIRETSTEARKWINPSNYNHSIWQYCYDKLQSHTLKKTYINFESYRQQLEKQKDSNLVSFIKIYRSIDFVFNERDKITRNIISRKKRTTSKLDEPKTEYEDLNNIDDDNDELVSAMIFEESETNNDIHRERLDDPVPDFTYIKQSTVANTEKYSANQIYRRTQAKFAHANKNERFISTNIRQLPLTTIQNICTKLWWWFDNNNDEKNNNREECNNREEKRAIAYLLLSLYTGYSVAQLAKDINENSKRIIDVSARKSHFDFIIQLDITPLRIKTTGIQSIIANRLTQFQLPIPIKLGTFLTYKGYPDNNLINEVIAKLRDELELPLLSLGRIEKSLYTILTHEVTTTQIASIITSRNSKKRADLWYCSHSIKEVKLAYSKAINILTARCHNRQLVFNYLDEINIANESIGSQNSPDYPIISLFIEHLRKKAISNTNFIERFNAYNLWLWHISLLLTSVRAVEGAPGFLNQFNLSIGLGWISDKEERASSHSQRLVPVCQFLSIAIKNFISYLNAFAKQFGRIEPQLKHEIFRILNSQRPLLNFIDSNNTFHSLRPSTITKELSNNFRFKVDWTRHIGQRFLHEQGVDEAMILAIFGHEMMGQEAWRKQSSLSIGDIVSVKDIYQKMTYELKLEQVVL